MPRRRETHSLRLEGVASGREEDVEGMGFGQDRHHIPEGHGVIPKHIKETQPVSASSQQTFLMLRQDGELMVGGGETAKVPRLVGSRGPPVGAAVSGVI